jgi:L-ribulose-5-phosphate 3-epimerase
MNRRDFLTTSAAACVFGPSVAAAAAPRVTDAAAAPRAFRISLAQWSYHRALRAREFDHLDFAQIARRDHGLDAIEYVNTFFKDRARDAAYLAEMNRRAADAGVVQHLIMIDGEGALGDPDATRRARAVDNHRPWLDAARTLGCTTIRVNAQSDGPPDERERLAADGLRRLVEIAAPMNLNVIVENHGGLSSRGDWLVRVMRRVDHPRIGTLPDFGNFYEYDRYTGVADMMPFAKAVSAKSHAFDSDGNETRTDYVRMLRIVRDAGFTGWVGIEYEGEAMPERDGIAKTLQLLQRVQRMLP